MKTGSRIKAGKRQGNPGYRTSAVFRGGKAPLRDIANKAKSKKTGFDKKG